MVLNFLNYVTCPTSYLLLCDTVSYKSKKIFGDLQNATRVYKTIQFYITMYIITPKPQ